jgi:hypothetical protein
MSTTREIFDNVITLQSDKWTSYFEVYDRYFSKFKDKASAIFMEVGIMYGGSIQMWRKFFGDSATIYGIDINPNVKNMQLPANNIFIGDQSNPAFWDDTLLDIPYIDCFLDDGGHTMEQQIVTLKKVWPKISHGGVYICEDLHTSYWNEYGGGYKNADSMIEFSKKLIDVINEQHLRNSLDSGIDVSNIESVHFYDSMLVIIKGKQYNQPIRNFQ